MAHERRDDGRIGVLSRRQAIGRVASLSAGAMVAGTAIPALAEATADGRLSIYEGRYSFDGHKLVEGYLAIPRGRSAMDLVVVLPGKRGLDDSVRALARRQARAGRIVFAPDLAKMAKPFASREAVIADVVAHASRMRRHGRGNGTVTFLAA